MPENCEATITLTGDLHARPAGALSVAAAGFSSAVQLSWHGQWALNAWPNLVITIGLLLLTLELAWWRGFSPLEMISTKADLVFVAALQKRFPRRMEV